MNLVIGYLYGDLMNIYGDTGNILALQKRAEWRGIEVKVKNISIGDPLKKGAADLYFFGGGQDQSQVEVAKDLQKKGKVLKEEIEREVPLLSICGGYQLLGHYYQPLLPPKTIGSKPQNGTKLEGISLFDAFTQASDQRMIGNIVIKSSVFSSQSSDNLKAESEAILTADYLLVGFENHSGKTFLGKGARPLGNVIKGFGNNGEDHTEGCIYKNAIGCYMHGSLLPKNPELADFLIKKALEVKYGKKVDLKKLDNSYEQLAHKNAILKFG